MGPEVQLVFLYQPCCGHLHARAAARPHVAFGETIAKGSKSHIGSCIIRLEKTLPITATESPAARPARPPKSRSTPSTVPGRHAARPARPRKCRSTPSTAPEVAQHAQHGTGGPAARPARPRKPAQPGRPGCHITYAYVRASMLFFMSLVSLEFKSHPWSTCLLPCLLFASVGQALGRIIASLP